MRAVRGSRRNSGRSFGDGRRESAVGRPENSWRVAETGHRRQSSHRSEIHDSPTTAPGAHVTDVSGESSLTVRGRRLPRRPHRHLPPAVRLIILSHERRRLVHVAVTTHPTAAWTAQQLREAFPNDEAPHFLVHDRDTAFAAVASTIDSLAVRDIPTARARHARPMCVRERWW
jgi:hypothetical protein